MASQIAASDVAGDADAETGADRGGRRGYCSGCCVPCCAAGGSLVGVTRTSYLAAEPRGTWTPDAEQAMPTSATRSLVGPDEINRALRPALRDAREAIQT